MFGKKPVAIAPEGTYFEIHKRVEDGLRLILWADGLNAQGAVYIDVPGDTSDDRITREFTSLVKRYEIARKTADRVGIYQEFPTKEEA